MALFRNLGVKLRVPLCDVLTYVSAQTLVFLDLANPAVGGTELETHSAHIGINGWTLTIKKQSVARFRATLIVFYICSKDIKLFPEFCTDLINLRARNVLHGQNITYYQLVGKGIKSPTSESRYFTGFPAGH